MKPYYQEPNVTLYCGHALNELRDMPGESVDCVMTSPPYWGLRTYKTEPIIWGDNHHCEHEWGGELDGRRKRTENDITDAKSKEATKSASAFNSTGGNFCLKCGAWKGELGLEPTIELYIDHLILIFSEVKRVLKKTGTCWVNIDDSYAGSWGDSGHRPERDGVNGHQRDKNTQWYKREGHPKFNPPATKTDVPAKSLCLIPSRFALAMVNSGWILRNDIVWNKSNPMPESVKDRFTGSWEHLFFFVKSQRYFFEQQFEPQGDNTHSKGQLLRDTPQFAEKSLQADGKQAHRDWNRYTQETWLPLGRNKRDVWEITTQPYPEAHFATFPEKLCETPILAGCPSHICKKCGKAREKVYEYKRTAQKCKRNDAGDETFRNFDGERWDTETIDKGYTDCGCNAGFIPGVVLDPFCGSGKALVVAKKLGRKAIGIELNPDYCKLAVKEIQKIPIPMELI